MATAIGTKRVSFTMYPLDSSGYSIHGGNHYANAHTVEDARDYARRVIGGNVGCAGCRGERVAVAVEIVGEEFEFTGAAWRQTRRADAYSYEIVR